MSDNIIALRMALSGAASVQAGIKAVSGALAAMRVALPVIVAGAVARELTQLTIAAIDAADAMGKLAQKSGVAVESLSGLSFAAKMGDLSSEEFANALKELNKEMASTGRATQSTDARLMELADQFAAMEDGPQKAKLALDNFGKAGIQMIPFLNQGSAAIRQQREEAKALGLVIDQQFAANADAFNDNLFRIKSSLNGLFLSVARDILPSLVQMTDQIVLLIKQTGIVAKTAEFVTIQFTLLGKVLKETAEHPFRPWFLNFFNATQATAASLFAKAIAGSITPVQEAAKAYGTLATTLDSLKSILAQQTGMADLLSSDPATRQGRRDQVENLKGQLRLLQQIAAEAQKKAPAGPAMTISGGVVEKTVEQIAFEKQMLEITKQRYDVEAKIRELEEQDNFGARMEANLRTLSEEWGNLGRNIADVMTGSVQTAVQGVSDAIYGLITGTATWGQVFAQVARQILKNIISMVVQWIASMTIMAALRKVFNTSGAAEASVLAAAWAPAAVAASIASYGVAASVGGAAYAAALVANTALTTGLTAAGYAQGGYTGNISTGSVAGEVHGQEFVFSAPATRRIGVQNLEALHDSASSGSGGVSVGGSQVSVGLINDAAQKREWLRRDPGVRKILIDLLTGAKFEMGLA